MELAWQFPAKGQKKFQIVVKSELAKEQHQVSKDKIRMYIEFVLRVLYFVLTIDIKFVIHVCLII